MGKTVTKAQVINRLGPLLNPLWVPSSNPHYAGLNDDQFYLPSFVEISTYVKASHAKIPAPANLGEGFDCDDFAYVFKGQLSLFTRDRLRLPHSVCCGIAWGRFAWVNEEHACNWVLTDDYVFHWIEPQTQSLYPLHDGVQGSLRLIIA